MAVQPNVKKRKLGEISANDASRSEKHRTKPKESREAKILLLETSILESRKNYNNIVKLLELAKVSSDTNSSAVLASVAICRVFCRLMVAGSFTLAKGAPEPEVTIVKWLKDRLAEFEDILFAWLKAEDAVAQSTALTLILRLMKENFKLEYSNAYVENMILKIVQCITNNESALLLKDLVEKFANNYDDLRLRIFDAVHALLEQDVTETQMDFVISLLISIDPLVQDRTDVTVYFEGTSDKKVSRKRASPQAQMKQAQAAWMAIFQQNLTKGQRKKMLEAIPTHIAQWFLDLELLMDFLTDSFNVGGSISLTALSGIFYLIQSKNLDYPHFYAKLYSLLDQDVLHSKHRSRVFRLLETFLSSTHLPAALVASFIKRLSRLSLNATPSAIVVVVPFIYNLLRAHPTCTFMIHRTTELRGKNEHDWGDPFDNEEADPMITHALESSLWEIQSLQSHYHPNVATIAKIISEPFTKHTYDLEDFLDHSYSTMLDAELSKKLNKPPEIEYEIPKRIFFKQEATLRKEDSLLVKLWDFN